MKIKDGVLTSYFDDENHDLTLTTAVVPDGVTKIGIGAFRCIHHLQEIILPNTLVEIASDAFSYCNELTKINIPNGVTHIGSRAFAKCGFTTITLPDSLVSLGDSVFYQSLGRIPRLL